MGTNGIRIAVGLSGGVDSSVAAALLQKGGYDVIGLTMEIFDDSLDMEEKGRHACYGPGEKADLAAAASVCEKLGILFYRIDLRDDYRTHVIDYFKREYMAGRTPNPCVVCNPRIKFGLLPEKAREAGIDFDLIATGHYARIVRSGGRFLLQKAVDLSKDQTYFLYNLKAGQLSKTVFPIGDYTKSRVREIASSLGLETADRPESQDFVAGGDYSVFFHGEEIKEGPIVDEEGHILGTHRGIIHYTVGQRRGLGIQSERPLYVIRIDAEKNRIVVSDRERLYSEGLIARDFNLLSVENLDRPYRVKAKIRVQHPGAEATVFPCGENKAKILFDAPQMSVTPGQAVVLYDGDIVFGGGCIEEAV